MEHRDANLAALAALGPRKRKPLETGSGTNQVLTSTQVPLSVRENVTVEVITRFDMLGAFTTSCGFTAHMLACTLVGSFYFGPSFPVLCFLGFDMSL